MMRILWIRIRSTALKGLSFNIAGHKKRELLRNTQENKGVLSIYIFIFLLLFLQGANNGKQEPLSSDNKMMMMMIAKTTLTNTIRISREHFLYRLDPGCKCNATRLKTTLSRCTKELIISMCRTCCNYMMLQHDIEDILYSRQNAHIWPSNRSWPVKKKNKVQ